jgi:hypothetical protein
MLRLVLCTSLLALAVSCSADEPSPVGPGDCLYQGAVLHPGDIFPADDGCNTCQCNPQGDAPGEVACTHDTCSNACSEPVPIGGCSEEECVPDGECGGDLYHCDPTTHTWDRVGYCEPWFPLDVHGTWALTLALDGADPCPEVARVDATTVHAGFGSAEYVLSDDAGAELGIAQVENGHNEAAAYFDLASAWSAADGAPIDATIQYAIDITVDGSIGGHAMADVAHGDALCHYDFAVTGTWSPPSP